MQFMKTVSTDSNLFGGEKFGIFFLYKSDGLVC